MVDRRTFTTLLAGTIAAPTATFAQNSAAKKAFYSAVGPELTLYSVDVDDAALVRQGTVSAPANIQYAWPHPSKRYLYVVSSNGGPSSSGTAGDKHAANAFRIDPSSGALTPQARLCAQLRGRRNSAEAAILGRDGHAGIADRRAFIRLIDGRSGLEPDRF